MSRNIVICCDGTWNVPDEVHGGAAAPTNVAKLALRVSTGGADDQRLFYEPGVGTSPDDRLVGGAFGYGLSANVVRCYRFLVENYAAGDLLFIFGFSRGAYTARSLAGLIRNCGILLGRHVDQVDAAFALYRDRTSSTHPSALAAQIFRRSYSHPDDDIHFIGVWDTVGALGIPQGLPGWKAISKAFPQWESLWGFHDTRLSSHVTFAYQALAIDEQRAPFAPTLWTRDAGGDYSAQTLEQVWFSGVHSEVGGGASDSPLPDIALLWLVEKARAAGLYVDRGALRVGALTGADGQRIEPDYAAPIVDSRSGLYQLLRPYHRLARLRVADAPEQRLASSAQRRFAEHLHRYSPPGWTRYTAGMPVVEVVATAGNAPQRAS